MPRISRSASERGGGLNGSGAENRALSAARALALRCNDPLRLASAAEQAALFMPAGSYIRARLWSQTIRLIAQSGVLNGASARLLDICEEAGITSEEARRWANLGRTLEQLDNGRKWSPGGLVHAGRSLFLAAARQRTNAKKYLRLVARVLASNPKATDKAVHDIWCRRNGSQKSNLDIIKPSDWWAFSRPKWRRDADFPGSIPGEVYANALYYFAPRQGIAADPMAGSGMLRRIYRDRRLWQKDSAFKLTIRLSDIEPRRPYIARHDARSPLSFRADWIFIDPPYFGQSDHLYSGGLARARTYRAYLGQLERVIRAMTRSLRRGGRMCLLLPKWSGKSAGHLNRDLPSDARRLAELSGLRWIDCAYVSRGRQQEQGFGFQNIAAKRARRLVSDTCVLNVFEAH
jgi:hypothetical protein